MLDGQASLDMFKEERILESFSQTDLEVVKTLAVSGLVGRSSCRAGDEMDAEVTTESLQSCFDQALLRGDIGYAAADAGHHISIADMFCGAGGLSYGVREAVLAAGMVPRFVLAGDNNLPALDVYRRNFDPEHWSSRNIWTSVTNSYSYRNGRARFVGEPRIVDDALLGAVGKVDILLGGPPCEGHSTSNNVSRRSDPRNMYYVAMPALAVALKAKAVIVENVPGIRHDRRQILDEAKALFGSRGYYVDEAVIDATRLGLPQTRKRHILVASVDGQPDLSAAVKATARPPRDLRWAIGDIVQREAQDFMDMPAELSKANRDRIDYLFSHDEFDLPNEWRPDCHRDGHTYPSIYGRLRWDRPAGTITTGFNTPGRGRFIHPELRRTITPREAARIQGFPDTFEFRTVDGNPLSRSNVSKMIGGAVPPQIGYAAGVTALAAMSRRLGRRQRPA